MTDKKRCGCADSLNFGEPQPDCSICGGTGFVPLHSTSRRTESKTVDIYHPLQVLLTPNYNDGSVEWPGNSVKLRAAQSDPRFGTTDFVRNNLECPVGIMGVRTFNPAWEIFIFEMGPVRGPFDAAAFNLDAVPGPPPRAQTPAPEKPRFVHYPMGVLKPGGELKIRAAAYGTPSVYPTLNMLFFVVPLIENL